MSSTCEQQNAILSAANAQMTKQFTDMSEAWNQIQTSNQTPPPTFWMSILVLVVFVVVTFIGFLYNSILNHQVMLLIDKNGVLDAMVKVFKTGNFAVDIEGQEHTFRYFWAEVLLTISKVITRGRFFLTVALFMVFLGIILLTYSIYYRGENYQAAARMISIALSLILGFTFLFTNNRTMTGPFENVIGYAFAQFFMKDKLKDAITGIFKHKYFNEKYVFPGANLYYDFILNTLSVDTFPEVMEELYKNNAKYDFELNTDPEKGINIQRVKNLFEIVLNKNTIGTLCWLYFATLVGSMISFQYILANEI